MPGEVTVLFVEVAGRPFAVEVGQVETLRRKETLYPAGEGPAVLLGFLPIGGAALPVVDLAMCLGLSAETGQRRGPLLVSALESAPLVFQVERVQGPATVAWSDLALLPELLQALQPRQVVWGLVRHGDGLVPLLDLGQVLPPAEVAILMDMARAVAPR